LLLKNGKKLGFEFKYTASPKVTKSMQIALNDLKLDSLTVIIPHGQSFRLTEKINVCSLNQYRC